MAARFLPLYLVSIAGRLLIYFLFTIIIEKIVRALEIHFSLVIPTLVLFLSFQSLVAREWMLGGVETKSFAYICALGALFAFTNRRYRTMLFLTGLAASFHILVGVYASFSLGVAMLFNLDTCRKDLKKIAFAIPFALAAGVPAICAVFQYLTDSVLVDSYRSGIIYVIERLPHHTFPGAWTKPWVVRFAATCLLFAGILRYSRSQTRRMFAAYGLGSAVLFCTGLALYHTGNLPWLKLYWFRLPDVIIPFIGFFLLASLVSDILANDPAAISESRPASTIQRLRKPFLALALILSAAGILKSVYHFTDHACKIYRSDRPFYLAHLDPDLREALAWIKTSTPSDSSILASPAIDEFYIAAERAMLVSFKHSAQIDSDNIEWYNRIVLTNGGNAPLKKGFSMQDELERSFYALTTEEIEKIARLYKMDYYLGTNRDDLPYRKAFSNSKYAVYYLGIR